MAGSTAADLTADSTVDGGGAQKPQELRSPAVCTLIAFYRCSADAHLWVAANRDEFHERPSEAPALRSWRGMPFIAPSDRRAGGTWWGLNREGVFAALTNRPVAAPDPNARSRGLVVRDAMAHATAEAAVEEVCAAPPGSYNPFNLLVVDATRAFTIVYEGGEPRPQVLTPGVWVIGNADPNARDSAKVHRTLERSRSLLAGDASQDLEGELAALCRSHDAGTAEADTAADPLASVCVHAGPYGTRCSTLLRLAPAGNFLRHAEGAPCTSPYRDLTPLLVELAEGLGSPNSPRVRKAS